MEDTAAAVETPVTVSTFGVSRHPDTARLVLSSPKPPGVREEFVGVVRKAFRPRASGGGGAGRTPPARWGWALTALQTVFPVLQWGRTYNFKLFRSDVMAGLTLASLGIPQVRSNFYYFFYTLPIIL
jgi:low affinity sulfate transporter 2